jgi:diacylglycerol kinase (ATP)
MRIGIVFNPRSGSRRGDRLHRLIKASIIGSDHAPVFLDVANGVPLEQDLAPMLANVDVVATIGGDGTLNGVINGIMASEHKDMPVAFFPAGRGRDAARTIPSFSLDMVGKEAIDWSTTRRVDIGLAQQDGGAQRYFVNAGDVGLIGAAAEFAARLPRQIGTLSYVLGGVYGFLATHPAAIQLTLDDDQVIELDNALSVAVCNGRAFGGGIYIAPDASAEDGILDIVVVRNANIKDLLLNLPKLKRGTLREHPALERWRARTLRVEAAHLGPIDLDGEMWGTLPLTFSVQPSSLNWIGPRT